MKLGSKRDEIKLLFQVLFNNELVPSRPGTYFLFLEIIFEFEKLRLKLNSLSVADKKAVEILPFYI